MANEIKSEATGAVRVESYINPKLKTKVDKHLKKLNISRSQFIRDLIQGAMKGVRVR